MGELLSQKGVHGNAIHPVSYFSHSFRGAEKNYSVTDKECLAVVISVHKFRVYILGLQTEVRTDHALIKGLINKLDFTGRYAQCEALLSEFDLSITIR